MNITILGSGGCTVIPRPLCPCRICIQARRKGPPYSRSGPSIFIHARRVVFVHLEEYWNRSYDDYTALEQKMKQVRFAFDGMTFNLNPKK